MKKIGFVFFDGLHIIHHFVGVAVELDKDPEFNVSILTFKDNHSYLYSLLSLLNTSKSIVKELPTYHYRKFIEKIKNRKQPSTKYLFEKNKDLLLGFDVLIFNDINHEYLYKQKKKNKPKFVLLMHGAGDGEYMIGESYTNTISNFDLISTPGKKISSFYQKMNLPSTKIIIGGYPKFDIVNIEKRDKPFFQNNKPIILYNPHFKKDLSSWYKFGFEILDFFYHNDDYNLIFAPHINLFNKKGFLNKKLIPLKYFNKKNILIDIGSVNSVNMSYTKVANLYLGDVSSQIYEFLINPRPCIFINSQAIDWETDSHYKNWNLGKVIKDLSHLETIIKTSSKWHKEYNAKQKEAIAYTFDVSQNINSSKRIAKAIKELFLKPYNKKSI